MNCKYLNFVNILRETVYYCILKLIFIMTILQKFNTHHIIKIVRNKWACLMTSSNMSRYPAILGYSSVAVLEYNIHNNQSDCSINISSSHGNTCKHVTYQLSY